MYVKINFKDFLIKKSFDVDFKISSRFSFTVILTLPFIFYTSQNLIRLTLLNGGSKYILKYVRR